MSDATPLQPSLPTGEDATSQIPAIDLLMQLGWSYLSPAEALEMRGGRTSQVLLRTVLEEQLARINTVKTRTGTEDFSREAIATAVQRLANPDDEGLVTTNEKVWDLLRLGISIPMTIDGRRRSHPLRYIDWDHPENNVFHVSEEFAVDRRGGSGSEKTRRPDLVCFVNGIPFVVIECKPASLPGGKNPIRSAISQHLRNQRKEEIERLFHYTQILIGLSVNQAKYGATNTPMPYWSRWRERDFDDQSLEALTGSMCPEEIDELRECLERSDYRNRAKAWAEAERYLQSRGEGRTPTEQDRLLRSLCTPTRLLELTRHYTLFEAGDRKIARYQQYFCVKKCLDQFETIDGDSRRAGGIVWHTQGSGKSLTMCLLAARVLAVHAASSPRVVIVTDRVDLDEQIEGTFQRVGADVARAESSRDLEKLLKDPRSRVIMTTVHKFESIAKRDIAPIDDSNIFVFVDEGHRTQTGQLHAAMRRFLPAACLTGFTGTPILRGDKVTARSFGGIIDTYTIADAVADGAVVNLLYEGRYSEQYIEQDPIDTWLAHHTHSLSQDQVKLLKARYSTVSALNETEQRIRRQAADIALHFKTVFQSGDTGFKAQLVAPSKAAAIQYKKCLDETGLVTSEVLISPPDTREGNTAVEEGNKDLVKSFFEEKIREYGSEEQYRKDVIRKFKKESTPEIIIVVDMLLTGFDAPKNACLYLTRSLQGHTLLQAIARVNRVCEGKRHGLILDYYGVVAELDDAVNLYSTFKGEYDEEDLADVLTDVRQSVRELPDAHAAVWACFNGVPRDQEAHEQSLQADHDRRTFYDRLSTFARKLKLALGSEHFWREQTPEKIESYRHDLTYFMKLRAAVAIRYAETVDFGQFDASIRKLLDEHVGAEAPQTIVEPTTIFDDSILAKELEQFETTEAKAEVIANRVERTIHEKMEEDPALFTELGEMLQAARDRYHEDRMAANFLTSVNRIVDTIRESASRDDTDAYQGIVRDILRPDISDIDDESLALLACAIDNAISERTIVDWQNDTDIQNRMKTEIEDAIFAWQDQHGVEIGFDLIDELLDQSITTAKRRSTR